MKKEKRIIAWLAVIISVLAIVGNLYISNLANNGIKVMPFSIGMCLIIAILFIIQAIMFKKTLQ